MTDAAAGPLRLRTAISSIGSNRGILDGSVTVPGVEWDHVEVTDHAERFARMGRHEEFDVCELSAMSYFAAREHGLAFRALPVVPRHGFRHRDFLVHRDAGIEAPGDLAGRVVGSRSYTTTPAVLDRGLLDEEFGVDLTRITWMLAEAEHIAACDRTLPANVVGPESGGDLFPLLVSGRLTAGIAGVNTYRQKVPEVLPLFPDFVDLDRAEYLRTGVLPVFTLIVVHERVLAGRPWLERALFDAFATSHHEDPALEPDVEEVVRGEVRKPFGLADNRAGLEHLLGLGRKQGIIRVPLTIDDLFPDFD